MSSKGSTPQKRVVTFDSDDSSASDAEEGTRGGDALAREMAAAAERERRKNPHGETGRAKAPRSHRIPQTGTTVSAPYKAKTMDLFSSDSSSSSSDEAETTEGDKAKAGGSRGGQPTAAPPSSGSKVAHVQGLSFRAVKAGGQPAAAAEDSSSHSDSDEEEKDEALHINKAFATRYEEQKRKQELHTLAEKYKKKLGRVAAAVTKTTGKSGSGSDDDDDYVGASEDEEDDAEEDDDAVLLTRENNLNFAKALLAVRKATVPLASSSSADATAGGGATAGPLLPKEELLKGRFFPPAEEQMKANTEIFEHYVDHKRHHKGDGAAFTLSDEYARALHATAQSEDAVVDSAEGRERDGLRKLRPQTAEEAKLRAAFLKSVEGSADTFEVVRGSKSNEAEKAGDEMDDSDSAEAEERRLAAAREEEKRLLEEAFSLGKRSAAARKKTAKQGSEEAADDDGDDPDSFLRDFFVQELWRPGSSAAKRKKGRAEHAEATDDNDDGEDDEEDGNANGGSYYDRLAQLAREEEDEAFFNDAEVWEREYQEKKYRHQEAEEEAALSGGAVAAHVQTFPRPIGEAATGLLRKPDTARKDARQRRRERAEAAHAQQVEELKRLKHLKRKEIEDQRALIASVAGLTVGKKRVGGGSSGQSPFAGADADEEAELARLKAVWSDKDLDAPFDPAEFDKKMAQLFNEDYYNEKNVDEDEIAFFDEELDKADDGEGDEDPNDDDDLAAIKAGAAPALFAADSLEAAQAMLPAKAKKTKKNKKQDSGEKFFDDVFGPQHGDHRGTEADDGTSDALALLYPSEALQALEKDRQQLNELMAAAKAGSGSASESNEELLERLKASLKKKEEEYYQLHRNAAAEGAGGGLPFRYREVEPEDFTLSIEEILALDDRQLNMIAPINCYAAYLDKESNERDRRRIERRRQKGFREIASDRSSRRYGDVKSTALLNPEQINDEEGAAIAEKLSKRLREEGEDPDAPLEKAPRQQQQQQQFHSRGGRGGAAFRGAHRGSDYGRGRGGGRGASGGPRGRGGPAAPFRGRGGGSDAFGAAQRGGRGGPRGRGGFRGRGA